MPRHRLPLAAAALLALLFGLAPVASAAPGPPPPDGEAWALGAPDGLSEPLRLAPRHALPGNSTAGGPAGGPAYGFGRAAPEERTPGSASAPPWGQASACALGSGRVAGPAAPEGLALGALARCRRLCVYRN